jgi:protein CpxP
MEERMTRIRGMMVVALVGLMVSTGNLLAHRGGGGPDGMMMKHLRGLELTDAQKEQIKGLVEAFHQENADEMEQMKALHQQARTARQNGDFDGAKETMQLAKEIRQSMKADHEELRAAILNVLSAEQRAELEERKGERKEKCRKKGDRERGEQRAKGERGRAERGGDADID